jgi:hypothetical protein
MREQSYSGRQGSTKLHKNETGFQSFTKQTSRRPYKTCDTRHDWEISFSRWSVYRHCLWDAAPSRLVNSRDCFGGASPQKPNPRCPRRGGGNDLGRRTGLSLVTEARCEASCWRRRGTEVETAAWRTTPSRHRAATRHAHAFHPHGALLVATDVDHRKSTEKWRRL